MSRLKLLPDNSLVSSPTALIAFHRLDTGEKLLWPVELQAKARIAEQEAASARQEALLIVLG